jgi:hypothetical protein
MTKLSGYTTVRNALSMDYPFVESIGSMLEFCDEVCVLDSSDKADGTRDVLAAMCEENPGRLVVRHVDLDWKAPNHGIFDGQTKQMARELCTGDILWQQDVDEVLHENSYKLIRPLVGKLFPQMMVTPIIALPVVEFWGNHLNGKVRLDVNLWKWRLSLKHPSIQHGIPLSHRKFDASTGLMYAKPGTDTCDYINPQTGQIIPSITLIPQNIENMRRDAATNPVLVPLMEQWLKEHTEAYPTVYHYSWFDITRKINHYKEFWTGFWQAMYNIERDETTNPFFPGRTWASVTDKEILELAVKLETETCGWIFHQPWDGSKTFGATLKTSHPKIMERWIQARTNPLGNG